MGGFDVCPCQRFSWPSFATRLSNIFVIGQGNQPWISLPKDKGVKLSISEERDKRLGLTEEAEDSAL